MANLGVMSKRFCCRVACGAEAVSTLTFDYADSMAVVGPLSFVAEPHSYDLCTLHSERLVMPRGWQVIRHKSVDEVGFNA